MVADDLLWTGVVDVLLAGSFLCKESFTQFGAKNH